MKSLQLAPTKLFQLPPQPVSDIEVQALYSPESPSTFQLCTDIAQPEFEQQHRQQYDRLCALIQSEVDYEKALPSYDEQQEKFESEKVQPLFENVKHNIEEILVHLTKADISSELKQDSLHRLERDLRVCGPGIQGNLVDEAYCLAKHESIVGWLSDIRTQIFGHLCSEHCVNSSIYVGNQIHVSVVFGNYACDQQWGIHGVNIKNNMDPFASAALLQIDEKSILSFHHKFIGRYNLEHIINWFTSEICLVDSINKDYKGFCRKREPILKELDIGTIEDITAYDFDKKRYVFKRVDVYLRVWRFFIDYLQVSNSNSDANSVDRSLEALIPLVKSLLDESSPKNRHSQLLQEIEQHIVLLELSEYQEIKAIALSFNQQFLTAYLEQYDDFDDACQKTIVKYISTYISSESVELREFVENTIEKLCLAKESTKNNIVITAAKQWIIASDIAMQQFGLTAAGHLLKTEQPIAIDAAEEIFLHCASEQNSTLRNTIITRIVEYAQSEKGKMRDIITVLMLKMASSKNRQIQELIVAIGENILQTDCRFAHDTLRALMEMTTTPIMHDTAWELIRNGAKQSSQLAQYTVVKALSALAQKKDNETAIGEFLKFHDETMQSNNDNERIIAIKTLTHILTLDKDIFGDLSYMLCKKYLESPQTSTSIDVASDILDRLAATKQQPHAAADFVIKQYGQKSFEPSDTIGQMIMKLMANPSSAELFAASFEKCRQLMTVNDQRSVVLAAVLLDKVDSPEHKALSNNFINKLAELENTQLIKLAESAADNYQTFPSQQGCNTLKAFVLLCARIDSEPVKRATREIILRCFGADDKRYEEFAKAILKTFTDNPQYHQTLTNFISFCLQNFLNDDDSLGKYRALKYTKMAIAWFAISDKPELRQVAAKALSMSFSLQSESNDSCITEYFDDKFSNLFNEGCWCEDECGCDDWLRNWKDESAGSNIVDTATQTLVFCAANANNITTPIIIDKLFTCFKHRNDMIQKIADNTFLLIAQDKSETTISFLREFLSTCIGANDSALNYAIIKTLKACIFACNEEACEIVLDVIMARGFFDDFTLSKKAVKLVVSTVRAAKDNVNNSQAIKDLFVKTIMQMAEKNDNNVNDVILNIISNLLLRHVDPELAEHILRSCAVSKSEWSKTIIASIVEMYILGEKEGDFAAHDLIVIPRVIAEEYLCSENCATKQIGFMVLEKIMLACGLSFVKMEASLFANCPLQLSNEKIYELVRDISRIESKVTRDVFARAIARYLYTANDTIPSIREDMLQALNSDDVQLRDFVLLIIAAPSVLDSTGANNIAKDVCYEYFNNSSYSVDELAEYLSRNIALLSDFYPFARMVFDTIPVELMRQLMLKTIRAQYTAHKLTANTDISFRQSDQRRELLCELFLYIIRRQADYGTVLPRFFARSKAGKIQAAIELVVALLQNNNCNAIIDGHPALRQGRLALIASYVQNTLRFSQFEQNSKEEQTKNLLDLMLANYDKNRLQEKCQKLINAINMGKYNEERHCNIYADFVTIARSLPKQYTELQREIEDIVRQLEAGVCYRDFSDKENAFTAAFIITVANNLYEPMKAMTHLLAATSIHGLIKNSNLDVFLSISNDLRPEA